jgi:predicted RNA-binding Zn-ribbon protein involved in translation (DUF1610 family)
MRALLKTLGERFPELRFRAGEQFSWSPETGEIIYKTAAAGQKARWSLLHETGHALLKHRSYGADFELLRLEIEAWERAKTLAKEVGVTIDEDHIQDCLDTYRDWLYKRSICPSCGTKCLQQDDFVHYRCFNCHTAWRVSASRFGRAYRRRTADVQAVNA